MLHLMSTKWVLTFACIAGVVASGVAMAHGGGGHGGGGGHSGGGHMGGGGHIGGGGHHVGGTGYHHSGGGTYHHTGGGYYGGGIGGIGLFYGGGFGYPGYGYGGYYGGYPSYGNGTYGYAQPVYSTPVYSQPVYSNTVYSGSSSIVTTPSVVTSTPQVTYDNGEIVLFSPPTNTQDAQYTLNGNVYSMKPGTVQKFTNDRTWTIDVNLGNGQTTKYTLSTGRYKFKQSDTGMGLFSTQDQPGAPVAAGTAPTTPAPAPAPMPVE